ncbi:hypothetical protein DCAR_0309970 [Daucus carota subsp. sativus]|uniref:F-box domain-containing protein n=2 Tax=Daucus carota subsp. sativus TaxID=79200 RepID=A0AAF0WJX7_DAUCS|nr:PREDICTED: F-box protein At1g47056-like [Daucus carota subsp. sativus]WOG90726.1 hypothetical protein DCAR_0309970 [Daucus carota subsp. sativus]
MGQSTSTPSRPISDSLSPLSPSISPRFLKDRVFMDSTAACDRDRDVGFDYTSCIPDECLACVFQLLGSGDRKRCSLVCRRWLRVEGQSRYRLSLNASSEISGAIERIFDRFDSVTKLALKCERRSESIGDEALVLVSEKCRKLTRLKIRACKELSGVGMSALARNCRNLRKFSCGSCTFGAKGMNALLDNCPTLEELSVKRLRCNPDGAALEPIGPGLAGGSLKTICLKELYSGQCFGPLIMGAKNLKTLKLNRCSGDWDKLLEEITSRVTSLVEVHLERIQVSDAGVAALASCVNIEILHLVKTPECTNLGLMAVAEGCKLIRKLHIDGWKTNRISDEGLIAVARHCPNLLELVLIGVNPTCVSIERLATNCQSLERLALCGSETVGDAEISCIAAKCVALKKLCIKSCPVSDHGMEALAGGCPNLVKVKVKKCRAVTSEGADWLRLNRASVAVNLDTPEPENQEVVAGDGAQEVNAAQNLPGTAQDTGTNVASSSSGRPRSVRSASFKARLRLTAGRSLVGTLRRWSSFSGSTSGSSQRRT